MALVRVRSKQPINGEHIETEVDEAWLARWPDDFDRVDDEPAAADPKASVPTTTASTRTASTHDDF